MALSSGAWIKLVAWAMLGKDGKTALQLIVVAPEATGAGAIQVLLEGRAAMPEKILLVDAATEEACTLDDTTDDAGTIDEEARLELIATDDETVINDEVGGLLLPPPPPPQETNIKQPVIKIIFLTQVCMAHTSALTVYLLYGLIMRRLYP
ncbi:MAG: hypothetical protein B0W54_21355 [Cellvibrio sp. 79]|nr:MAG: hypothetical protein B0W54_21355 [Cellvibrio sp. 79]